MPRREDNPEADVLGRIGVRLIQHEEREGFDRLLEEKYYLQSAKLGGHTLRYVAEVDGEWVDGGEQLQGLAIGAPTAAQGLAVDARASSTEMFLADHPSADHEIESTSGPQIPVEQHMAGS